MNLTQTLFFCEKFGRNLIKINENVISNQKTKFVHIETRIFFESSWKNRIEQNRIRKKFEDIPKKLLQNLNIHLFSMK